MPSAVWIDETGKVLRIDEGSYAEIHKMGSIEFGRDDYVPMVRDWVEKGANSQYVADAGAVSELSPPKDAASLADAVFKLGVFFYQKGDRDLAAQYWKRAQTLNPESWNYHRQDWSFEPETAGQKWGAKFQTLDGKPYYRPVRDLDTAN